MLIGEYIHTLDDKNRLSVPVKFRKEMGKNIVLTPGLDKCLFVFTLKEWSRISEKLSESSLLSADSRSFNRYMLGGAQEVEVDANGRMLIPEYLQKRAGIKSKAVFIGVQNRVEIWAESEWNEYKKVVEKEADSLAEKLSGVGAL
jgi:MraZ protein